MEKNLNSVPLNCNKNIIKKGKNEQKTKQQHS